MYGCNLATDETSKKYKMKGVKMKILANKNGFVLAHDEYYGDYCFGTEREIKNLSMPCNQYGTKKEIKAELERWKKEVDFDNPRILEVEAFFISVLTHCEN